MTEYRVLIIKYCLYSAVNIYYFTELKISNGSILNELTIIKFIVESTYEILLEVKPHRKKIFKPIRGTDLNLTHSWVIKINYNKCRLL